MLRFALSPKARRPTSALNSSLYDHFIQVRLVLVSARAKLVKLAVLTHPFFVKASRLASARAFDTRRTSTLPGGRNAAEMDIPSIREQNRPIF
jgi:hypothetical protein